MTAMLQYAVLPMVALNAMLVAFYLIYATFFWPRMPRREAVFWAPIAVPVTFLFFFLLLQQSAADGMALRDLSGNLALVLVAAWISGIAAGAITYALIRKSRDH